MASERAESTYTQTGAKKILSQIFSRIGELSDASPGTEGSSNSSSSCCIKDPEENDDRKAFGRHHSSRTSSSSEGTSMASASQPSGAL